MRLVVANCSVDYAGRLSAHLPPADRLIMVKADGCVAIHADGGAYKPLNWMNAPNTLVTGGGEWVVTNPKGERLTITLHEVRSDSAWDLGVDPGLQKDGVEAHLQELLAASPHAIELGLRLVRREYPTAIGPIDLVCRDAEGHVVVLDVSADVIEDVTDGDVAAPKPAPTGYVAVEVKRRAGIDAVEQLSRYLEFLNADPYLPGGVRGVLCALDIAPQARTLAMVRGIRCVVVDYDELRGMAPTDLRLF